MKTKKRSLVFLLLLLLVVCVGSTYAVFYTQLAIPNKFDIMLYNVQIDDDFSGTWGVRNVKFTNKDASNSQIVLRISYNELWNDKESDSVIKLNNLVDGKNVVEKEWTDEFLKDFFLADDRWYYYKKVLQPNESVQVLKSVNLNEQLISKSPDYFRYKNYNYELSFNYEAVSAVSNDIKDAWGINASIKEGDVNWEF